MCVTVSNAFQHTDILAQKRTKQSIKLTTTLNNKTETEQKIKLR